MTSKERVRKALQCQKTDRVPAAFEATGIIWNNLMKHYGFTTRDEVYEKFQTDTRYVSPRYIGPPLQHYVNEQGQKVQCNFWGFECTQHITDKDAYFVNSYAPLNEVQTMEDLDKYTFPDPDWFDYSSITEACDKYPDKAIVMGHEGAFQIVTDLISMENFFILMMEEPEVAQEILNRQVAFELEYYRRSFEAGGGRVDILRPHDDYGTQISLLFSIETWRTFFKENTQKLVDLTHEYGAFYMQHSCGAVFPMIEELIKCKVDALEPVQKTVGMELENLQKHIGKITYHGGIDTQNLLPYGTPEEVKATTEEFIQTLGQNGGYILMSSQIFEIDTPLENIEAVYSANREV